MADLDTDGRIREIAAGFHGLVTRQQLMGAGIPAHAIDYRLRKHRMSPLFDGVYRVGPVAAPLEREAAVLLSCGGRAILSHNTAARLWRIGHQPRDAAVDVTAVRQYRRPGEAMRLHRVTLMHPDDVTALDGLPITTPARTIVDLAGGAGARSLEQLVAIAERAGLTDRQGILATLDRIPRRPGAGRLRALVAEAADSALTRSEAEVRFLALIRRGQLPAPQLNVRVCGLEVDVVWRRERLIVEVDGFAFHSTRRAFERDRWRDSQLAARGYRVMRITWRQLQEEPEAALVRVALALARAATGPSSRASS